MKKKRSPSKKELLADPFYRKALEEMGLLQKIEYLSFSEEELSWLKRKLEEKKKKEEEELAWLNSLEKKLEEKTKKGETNEGKGLSG